MSHESDSLDDDDPLVNDFAKAHARREERADASVPPPAIESYLSDAIPPEAQMTRLKRLLSIDIRERRRRGETVTLEYYAARLPRFQTWLERVFATVMATATASDSAPADASIHATSLARIKPLDAANSANVANSANSGDSAESLSFGRYRVERLLGEGTFGKVYLASDPELPRLVAIKTPHSPKTADLESFREEARKLARFVHPHIVRILDVGQRDGTTYIVTEYLAGGSLREACQRRRFTPWEAVSLVRKVAEALQVAHRAGVVHRDLKPSNILLDGDGEPKIVDFGLAVNYADFGQGQRFAGSIPYMSPEQARRESHRVDGRSDLFSLGVIFYELLTGERPFDAADAPSTLRRIIEAEARPPRQFVEGIPHELERICLKTLAKRVVDRYSCARDLCDDLTAAESSRVNMATARATMTSPAVPSPAVPWTSPSHSPPPPTAQLPGVSPGVSAGVSPGWPSENASPSETASSGVAMKGLRAFDADDAESYLKLVPGPRGKRHLPESLRFWLSRIESTDPTLATPVGVLYGPSGCGKTSFLRAGVLPRASARVIPIYVSATARGTEASLASEIHRRLGMSERQDKAPATLVDVVQRWRESGSEGSAKLLIVIDQFEQWLHANEVDDNSELARALRQCDGVRAQCLLSVRDDFWLGLSRFMQALEIPLLEGSNSLLVDLFDEGHARRVLREFGVGCGRLAERPVDEDEQRRFLEACVQRVSHGGRVVPVHLVLLVEMLKHKDWTLATIESYPEVADIGAAFLRDIFSSSSSPARYRIHRDAAAAVLELLAPPDAVNLKGGRRSTDEIRQVSGYESDPAALGDLLRLLDQELRLITPVEGPSREARNNDGTTGWYQLTHDYLVPSLRAWLALDRATTRRGRARLLLAERSAQWSATRDHRLLPGLREYAAIKAWIRREQWTAADRDMLLHAGRRLWKRGAVFGAIAVTFAGVLLGQWWLQRDAVARSQLSRLESAGAEDVHEIVREVLVYARGRQARLAAERDRSEGRVRLNRNIALAGLLEPRARLELTQSLFDPGENADDAAYFRAMCRALSPWRDEVAPELLGTLNDSTRSEHERFRAACGLAFLTPTDFRSSELAPRVVADRLIEMSVEGRGGWIRQVVGQSLPAIGTCWREDLLARDRRFPRLFAALREFLGDDLKTRLLLLELASEEQLGDVARLPLSPSFADAIVARRRTLAEDWRKAWETVSHANAGQERKDEGELERAAMRTTDERAADERAARIRLEREQEARIAAQANLTVALLAADPGTLVWPYLELPDASASDARWRVNLRSELARRLAAVDVDGGLVEARFRELAGRPLGSPRSPRASREATELRALLLIMGSRAPLSAGARAVCERLFAEHPDAGVHSMAAWVLRRSGAAEASERPGQRSSTGDWYISPSGETFVVVESQRFRRGSPEDEHQREFERVSWELPDGTHAEDGIEARREVELRRFAIAAHEVTKVAFQKFDPAYRGLEAEGLTRDPRDPAHEISWDQAGAYCNWLSGQEGIDPTEWAYDPATRRYRTDRTGYRLPTVAEWECAARGGTATRRAFGDSDRLLDDYAWGLANSRKEHFSPVGSYPPNDWGLFDTLGNVAEWTCDRLVYEQEGEMHVVKGGAYDDNAANLRIALNICVRAARVGENGEPEAAEVLGSMGFRLARTLPDGE